MKAQFQLCYIPDKDAELLRLGIDPKRTLTEPHVSDAQQRLHIELDGYILLVQKLLLLRPLTKLYFKEWINDSI